jgi:hypothetical protein
MLGAFRCAVRYKTCNFGPLAPHFVRDSGKQVKLGPLAQLVEQDPLKVKVLGSIPRRLINEATTYGADRHFVVDKRHKLLGRIYPKPA